MSKAARIWKFIWSDNSIWSWLLNAVIAFVLIKFVVYPGLGLLLQTGYPVVAVISDSMHHDSGFDDWWQSMGPFYEKNNISKEEFRAFTMSSGFNKGDIIILKGRDPGGIDIGDPIVFRGQSREPIIHRVIRKWEENGQVYFSTKGDRNVGQREEEKEIVQDRVLGNAWLRIPLVGYVKIIFSSLLGV